MCNIVCMLLFECMTMMYSNLSNQQYLVFNLELKITLFSLGTYFVPNYLVRQNYSQQSFSFDKFVIINLFDNNL